jgi:Uma2 family endonuclease
MSTALTMLTNPAIRAAVKQISVDEYHRLSDAAIIPENTELLHGIIIQQMTKSPLHTWTVERLVDWLRAKLPKGFYVRQEQPITLVDSEPEPDVAIVVGGPDEYRKSHPSTAEIIIEVTIATVDVDREKAFAYSLAGVQEYWIVLPQQRRVEVYTAPSPTGYLQKTEVTAPANFSFQQFPSISIDLDQLFEDAKSAK